MRETLNFEQQKTCSSCPPSLSSHRHVEDTREKAFFSLPVVNNIGAKDDDRRSLLYVIVAVAGGRNGGAIGIVIAVPPLLLGVPYDDDQADVPGRSPLAGSSSRPMAAGQTTPSSRPRAASSPVIFDIS